MSPVIYGASKAPLKTITGQVIYSLSPFMSSLAPGGGSFSDSPSVPDLDDDQNEIQWIMASKLATAESSSSNLKRDLLRNPTGYNCANGVCLYLLPRRDEEVDHSHVSKRSNIETKSGTKGRLWYAPVSDPQISNYLDTIRRPHPFCQCKWQTWVELRERTLEDHITHFTAEIPPIVKKQLVTLWQAEHHVLVEPVGAWHVFARL